MKRIARITLFFFLAGMAAAGVSCTTTDDGGSSGTSYSGYSGSSFGLSSDPYQMHSQMTNQLMPTWSTHPGAGSMVRMNRAVGGLGR